MHTDIGTAVDTIAGDETLGLDISGGDNVTELATNGVNTMPTTDEIHTIDNTVATVAIIGRGDPLPVVLSTAESLRRTLVGSEKT